MKKLVYGIVFLLLIVNVYGFQSFDTDEEDLRFKLLAYTPSPVSAGNNFEGFFEVTNIDREEVSNLKIIFGDQFPVFVDNEEINVNKLLPGESFSFKKEFSTSAYLNDTGQIKFEYSRNEVDLVGGGRFDIKFSDLNKDVEFDSAQTIPDKLRPGEEAKVLVSFQNSASSELRDIELKLNVSKDFIVLNSVNERRIDSLLPGERESVVFDIIVNPETEAGIYSVPLDIKYFDNVRKELIKTTSLGVVVDSKPEFEIFIGEGDAIQYGSSPEITLALSNVGTSDIKFMILEILDTEKYKVISQGKSYLGNLEPDDFETARFDVNIFECGFNCGNQIDFKVLLSYKDNFNNEIRDIVTVSEKIYRKDEAVALGLTSPSKGISNIIIGILLLMFVYFVWKDYKVNKDLGKATRKGFKKIILNVLLLIVWILKELKWSNIRRIPVRVKKFVKRND